MENGGLHTIKLWWYGLHRRKDQSGSKKRQIWSSCFDKCQKTRASEEDEKKGETYVVTAILIRTSFPPTQQCHYSANNKPSPYPPPSYPQRPSLNQPQSLSTALPMTNNNYDSIITHMCAMTTTNLETRLQLKHLNIFFYFSIKYTSLRLTLHKPTKF